MAYERCIFYTVLLAVVALDRPTLKDKVLVCMQGWVGEGREVLAGGGGAGPTHAEGQGVGWGGLGVSDTKPSPPLSTYTPHPTPPRQVIDSPEVLSVIDALPHLRPFLSSLYDCKYAQFFQVGVHASLLCRLWVTVCCAVVLCLCVQSLLSANCHTHSSSR